jgi:hypothetical protein
MVEDDIRGSFSAEHNDDPDKVESLLDEPHVPFALIHPAQVETNLVWIVTRCYESIPLS